MVKLANDNTSWFLASVTPLYLETNYNIGLSNPSDAIQFRVGAQPRFHIMPALLISECEENQPDKKYPICDETRFHLDVFTKYTVLVSGKARDVLSSKQFPIHEFDTGFRFSFETNINDLVYHFYGLDVVHEAALYPEDESMKLQPDNLFGLQVFYGNKLSTLSDIPYFFAYRLGLQYSTNFKDFHEVQLTFSVEFDILIGMLNAFVSSNYD